MTDLVLAAVRWLVFVAALVAVGTGGAQLVRLQPRVGRVWRPAFDDTMAGLGLGAAVLWFVAILAALPAQAQAWFGPQVLTQWDQYGLIATQTQWGANWRRSVLAALGVVIASVVARRWRAVRTLVSAGAAITFAVVVPMTGHGVGHSSSILQLHRLHVFGVGLWVGTLAVLAWSTRPLWTADRADLRVILAAFTPIALAGAGLAAASGTWMAADHAWPFSTLLEYAYGRTLVLKLCGVAAMAALGFLNWRRFVPGSGDERGRGLLARAMTVEVLLAFVFVLALTAWLSGLPMAMDEG